MSSSVYEVHKYIDGPFPIMLHHHTIHREEVRIGNRHEDIEILYCSKGSGQIMCNNADYDFNPGDLYIINSNDLHCSKTKSLLERYCLIIDSQFLKDNHLDPQQLEFQHCPNDPIAVHMFQKIIAEFDGTDVYKSASIRVMVLSLVLHLAKFHALPRSHHSHKDSIMQAVGYLQSNYSEHITLDKIAAAAGLSKYHLTRKFKAATGMTPIAFLTIIRCQNAQKLLLKNAYTVAEVAELCGFESTSYFTKTFKKATGMLPSAVRDNFKQA